MYPEPRIDMGKCICPTRPSVSVSNVKERKYAIEEAKPLWLGSISRGSEMFTNFPAGDMLLNDKSFFFVRKMQYGCN
jgi:hypothetical protein